MCCQSCQNTYARFRCIEEKTAKSRYALTDEDLEDLPFKWSRNDYGGRYSSKYDKQFLLDSVKQVAADKVEAERLREAARAHAAAVRAQESADRLARQEAAMLSLYTGTAADLQAVFDEASADRIAHRSTLLAAKHYALIAQDDTLTSSQINQLVDYHQALAAVEDRVEEAGENKTRSPHLQRALDTLDTIPGGVRASAKATWREVLAGNVKKDMTDFWAAVKRADTAQKKAEAERKAKVDLARALPNSRICQRDGCGNNNAIGCATMCCRPHCVGPCERH